MGEIHNLQNDTLKSKCAHQMFEGTHPKTFWQTEKDFDPNRESLSLRYPFQFVHVKSKSENLWCLRKLGGLILVKLFHSL